MKACISIATYPPIYADFRGLIVQLGELSCELISCHALSVLYLVAKQAIYNFAVRPRGICNSVEFRDAFCTCKLGLRSMVSESINQRLTFCVLAVIFSVSIFTSPMKNQ